MGKRDARILEVLTERKRVEVAELARELGVSSVTMRKDLDELEARDVIKREHGYALLGSPNDINGRLAYHYQTKGAIARAAADLVADGETVMVESGSCCALLALGLAQAARGVSVVTNSAFIASYVRREPAAKTVLLGGAYQNDSQVNVGPMVAQCAQNYCVERLFIGVDGYEPGQGFTNSDQMRAQAVVDMAAQAERVVVLTESDKFSRRGVVPMHLGDKVDCVVTDDGVDDAVAAAIEAAGVELVRVPRSD